MFARGRRSTFAGIRPVAVGIPRRSTRIPVLALTVTVVQLLVALALVLAAVIR